MKVTDFIKKKTLNNKFNTTPDAEERRLTFINNKDEIIKDKIKEYNVWYEGDANELLQYYTVENMFHTYTEPFYNKNKRNYFWCVSSGEEDIKRTHSGIGRDIIDSLVAIIGAPDYSYKDFEGNESNELRNILDATDFMNRYRNTQIPMTLVEGWGAWRIDWNKRYCKYPIAVYYRAENVEFIKKYGLVVGIIFKDYYKDEKRHRNYMVVETRRKDGGDLVIEQEVYLLSDKEGAYANQIKFEDLPGYELVENEYVSTDDKGTRTMRFKGLNCLLAEPCVFYKDPYGEVEGKSVFAGRIDLMDDLDQCLSQASNTVRKSTPIEYIDTNYLDRDKKGVPIMPKLFDRKFVKFKGAKDENGSNLSTEPVVTTQPNVNFDQYNSEAQQILLYIINGLISPATLGIDIAKKDNADAQREKEKVTVFTRNWITDIEQKILASLFNQLLIANEFMEHGIVTYQEHNIAIRYPEFADESYENKVHTLGEAFDAGRISPEMYLSKLYGESLTKEDYARELKYLKETIEDAKNGNNEMFGGPQQGQIPGLPDFGGEEYSEENK